MNVSSTTYLRALFSGHSLRLRQVPRERLRLISELQQEVHVRRLTSDILAVHHVFDRRQYTLPRMMEPKLIFDCGAHIGLATLYFASRYPDAVVVAVEPHKGNYDLLCRNTSHLKNVRRIRGAIWPVDEPLRIVNPWAQPWGFRVAPSASGDIRAVTLEELGREYGSGKGVVLKLDIEGSECRLIDQIGDGVLDIAECTFIEYHGFRGRKARKHLDDRGFASDAQGDTVYYLRGVNAEYS